MYEFNKQGILHRDLKPQNILLKFSGETRYPEPNQITLKIGNLLVPLFVYSIFIFYNLCI